jgi:hypothetical protein
MSEFSQSARQQSGHDPLVWYAGYGSNTDLGRFMCYIAGGTPVGTNRVYVGCKDPSPPLAHIALEIPYQLYFAGESRVWTGGVAFIGHTADSNILPTIASAYLIKLSQLEQLVAQENGREEIYHIDLQRLRDRGQLILGEGIGRYDGILQCGTYENIPIICISSPKIWPDFTKPAPAYLQTMASGLRGAIHGLTTDETVTYLLQKPGVAGNYSAQQLRQLFG